MALEKPKQKTFSFSVKEGIGIPKGITIPATINGVETTVNVAIVEGEILAPPKEVPATGTQVDEFEIKLKNAKEELQSMINELKSKENENEKLQKEIEKLKSKEKRKR